MKNVRYQLMKDGSLFKPLELFVNFFNRASLSNDLFEKKYIYIYSHGTETIVVVF